MGCSPSFVKQWQKDDPDFAANYARSKGEFAEKEAEGLLKLADSAIGRPPEVVNAIRLAVDTRKWIISKLLPKKYGDKPAEVNVATHVHTHVSIDRQREIQARMQAALLNGSN